MTDTPGPSATDIDALLPPLPAGVSIRAATPGDVLALVGLLRGDELAAAGESSVSETEVAAAFKSPRARERLTGRVLERDGQLIGLWRVSRHFDDKYGFSIAIDRTLPAPLVDELWRQGLQWAEKVAQAIAANPRSCPRSNKCAIRGCAGSWAIASPWGVSFSPPRAPRRSSSCCACA